MVSSFLLSFNGQSLAASGCAVDTKAAKRILFVQIDNDLPFKLWVQYLSIKGRTGGEMYGILSLSKTTR